jgi:DNA-binding XRE family transcriptional regulator
MPNPFPDGDYALAVYPIPNDARASYMSQKEGWIDLTSNKWFIPGGASPRLSTNKLVRIPSWGSMRKGTDAGGGGFIDAPAKVKDNFQKKGLLTKSDIEPYGTAATPWNMQLDYQWLRAHVRYVFVNWKDGKEENLPPGLIVQAVNDKGTVLSSQEMSQAELAHASGVGQATISAMEHERTAIGADRARKLARALHVHPAVLVFPEWEEEEDDSMRGSEERDIRTPR